MATVAHASGRTATRPRFYAVMAASFVVIAFGGFIPTYWAKLADGSFGGAPILHLHGAIFFTWTLFYFFQTSLVAAGRTLAHRDWGMAGISLATAMGFTVVLAVINSIEVAEAAGMGDAARRFAVVSLTGLMMFAAFFALAIINVRKSELHKRLMILAMIPVLQAAMGRVVLVLFAPPGAAGPPPPAVSVPAGIAVDLLIVVAMVYDWRTRGRVHPAYLVGLPLLVIQQLLVIPVGASAAWLAVARAVESLAG